MELNVIGSGSKGNCYLLQNDDEALLIECGVNQKHILNAIDFKTSKVVGCIISHEHGDHAGYCNQMMKYSIPLYMSEGTRDALLDAKKIEASHLLHICKPLERFKIGGYTIMPFDTRHDAREPLGFIISHKETGIIVFATDTYYLPYKFKDVTTFMIECNYDDEVLQHNIDMDLIHYKVANRVYKSHMSVDNCIDVLLNNDLSKCKRIILIHKSDNNSGGAEHIKRKVSNSIGKVVIVAENGIKLNLNKEAF